MRIRTGRMAARKLTVAVNLGDAALKERDNESADSNEAGIALGRASKPLNGEFSVSGA
jgi:hypothetical protein